MTQLRIDFPDYSAKEQEKDIQIAKRLRQQDVYISRVDGVWNAYLPRKRNSIVINGKKGEELTEFTKNINEDLREFGIRPHFRCVRNNGLDAHFRHNQTILRRLNNDGRGY